MVNAKEAAKISSLFVADLFPEGRDLRLEQVEPVGSDWEVVLSFQFPEHSPLMLAIGQPNRAFKAVKVDRDSGEPISVKVWKV